jgi:5-(carboxyamino)imidazole ribonucleotide synthase
MRIGIVGGGQLGRMLALAAAPLGLSVRVLGTDPDDPALLVARGSVGRYDDVAALRALAREVDVLTYEFENIPARALAAAIDGTGAVLHPPLVALEVGSDRLREKSTFEALGIPTAPFRDVPDAEALARAVAELGLPLVLKTRRLGYDGKGQKVLRAPADVPGAFEALLGVPCIVERFVPFRREVSLVAARSSAGEVVFHPLVENEHRGGILFRTRVLPEGPRTDEAERHVRALLDHFGHVGVLALEMFDTDAGLVANELAPRVHNSGHWSQDGCATSQFEQHLRAIAGLPLGRTFVRGAAAMVNCVGALPDLAALSALPDVHVHVYGKAPRPGRKVGHVNVIAPDEAALDARLAGVEALVRWA